MAWVCLAMVLFSLRANASVCKTLENAVIDYHYHSCTWEAMDWV